MEKIIFKTDVALIENEKMPNHVLLKFTVNNVDEDTFTYSQPISKELYEKEESLQTSLNHMVGEIMNFLNTREENKDAS